jgi:hypothetical protein
LFSLVAFGPTAKEYIMARNAWWSKLFTSWKVGSESANKKKRLEFQYFLQRHFPPHRPKDL